MAWKYLKRPGVLRQEALRLLQQEDFIPGDDASLTLREKNNSVRTWKVSRSCQKLLGHKEFKVQANLVNSKPRNSDQRTVPTIHWSRQRELHLKGKKSSPIIVSELTFVLAQIRVLSVILCSSQSTAVIPTFSAYSFRGERSLQWYFHFFYAGSCSIQLQCLDFTQVENVTSGRQPPSTVTIMIRLVAASEVWRLTKKKVRNQTEHG